MFLSSALRCCSVLQEKGIDLAIIELSVGFINTFLTPDISNKTVVRYFHCKVVIIL